MCKKYYLRFPFKDKRTFNRNSQNKNEIRPYTDRKDKKINLVLCKS